MVRSGLSSQTSRWKWGGEWKWTALLSNNPSYGSSFMEAKGAALKDNHLKVHEAKVERWVATVRLDKRKSTEWAGCSSATRTGPKSQFRGWEVCPKVSPFSQHPKLVPYKVKVTTSDLSLTFWHTSSERMSCQIRLRRNFQLFSRSLTETLQKNMCPERKVMFYSLLCLNYLCDLGKTAPSEP